MPATEKEINAFRTESVKMKYWAARIFEFRYLYIMLVPFILWFVFFAYRPLYGLVIAFKDYSPFKGIAGSPWVGLENFRLFFTGPYFFRTFNNVLLINCYSLIFSFPLPILLAIMLNEVKQLKFKKIVQTITYLPYFISVVIVAGMVTNFLAPEYGLFNILIEKLGGEKVYFLTKPQYFRTIYISLGAWKDTGFGAIVYMAALSAIDVQLYEAAKIDGAGKLQQLWHVTFPGILPTIIICLILRVGALLSVGSDIILLLYQPATYETADVFSTFVYRQGILGDQQSLAAAVGLFNSVVSLGLIAMTNVISRRLSSVSLW